jgi:acetoacetyl-CoA synthetase
MSTQRTSEQPPVLWQPDAGRRDGARVTHYLHWLAERGLATLSGYHELWRWSVQESELFWTSLIG